GGVMRVPAKTAVAPPSTTILKEIHCSLASRTTVPEAAWKVWLLMKLRRGGLLKSLFTIQRLPAFWTSTSPLLINRRGVVAPSPLSRKLIWVIAPALSVVMVPC